MTSGRPAGNTCRAARALSRSRCTPRRAPVHANPDTRPRGFAPRTRRWRASLSPMTAYRLLQHERRVSTISGAVDPRSQGASPSLFRGMHVRLRSAETTAASRSASETSEPRESSPSSQRASHDPSRSMERFISGAPHRLGRIMFGALTSRAPPSGGKEPRGPRALEQGTRSLSGGPADELPYTLPLLGPSRAPRVARDGGAKGRNPFAHRSPAKALVPAPPREGKRAPENRDAFHRCEFVRSRGSLHGRTRELASRYAAPLPLPRRMHCTRESLRLWVRSECAWS